MSKGKRKKDINWLIKNYISFLEEFGMNEKNIVEYYHTWKENRTESIEDYLWFIFNYLLNENAKQSEDAVGLFKRNDQIYTQMLSFRRRVEGKKANEILKIFNTNRVNLELEQNISSRLEIDFIIIGTKDCEESEKVDGKIISKREAIENNIIPYEKCTRNQGCVCLMNVKVRRDKNGRIVRKK